MEAQRYKDPKKPRRDLCAFFRRQRAGVRGGAGKVAKARKRGCRGLLFLPPEAQLRSIFQVGVSGLRCRRNLHLGFPTLQPGCAKLGRRNPVRGITDLRQPNLSSASSPFSPSESRAVVSIVYAWGAMISLPPVATERRGARGFFCRRESA